MHFDKNVLYVVISSVGAMLILAAAQTFRNIQKVFMESISEDEINMRVDAYFIFAIIYIVLGFSLWAAPFIIHLIGAKHSMIVGTFGYLLMIFQFLFLQVWLIYVVAVLTGIGAALVMVGLASYIKRNSNPRTIARNITIFWAIFQLSAILGNLFIYWEFQKKEKIDADTRKMVVYVLGGVAFSGMIIFMLLPKRSSREEEILAADPELGFLQNIKGAFRLLREDFKMSLICVTFFYNGICLAFYASIHNSCIAFTKSFADSKKLLGLAALLTGVGQMIGGALFGSLTIWYRHLHRTFVIIFGFLCHAAAYTISYLNLPDNCPFDETDHVGPVTDFRDLSLLSSFLLGLGDACFDTQGNIILGQAYTGITPSAFGLTTFVKEVGISLAFVYAPFLRLYWQLLILSVFLWLGTVCFIYVDRVTRQRIRIDSTNSMII